MLPVSDTSGIADALFVSTYYSDASLLTSCTSVDGTVTYTYDATGLRNHVNRWSDPRTGDWMSEDPIGFGGQDANPRRFCRNQPTTLVDPYGLLSMASLEGVLLALLDTFPGLTAAQMSEARQEAHRIAESIQSLWNQYKTNWSPISWFSEREKGYWCYQWAFGFEQAFYAVHPKYFACSVEYAVKTGSDAVHYWLTIWTVNNPGAKIYVDDGFSRGYVHTRYPLPAGYVYQGKGNKKVFDDVGGFVPIPGQMPPFSRWF